MSMFKREIKVGNAVIEYSGSDHVIERINCTDRIEEEIIVQVNFTMPCRGCKTSLVQKQWHKYRLWHLNNNIKNILIAGTVVVKKKKKISYFYCISPHFLQVLSVGSLYNPDVRYSFNIPIEDKPQQFFWDAYGPWQECSRLCQGEGRHKCLEHSGDGCGH